MRGIIAPVAGDEDISTQTEYRAWDLRLATRNSRLGTRD